MINNYLREYYGIQSEINRSKIFYLHVICGDSLRNRKNAKSGPLNSNR